MTAVGGGRRAVFLDRDGTIIEDKAYVADPNAVTLIPGVASAIARVRDAGFAVVVVTNQSGIARGVITPTAYAEVEARVSERLAEAGASVDATYMCPHHPDVTGPCDCRKPAPGLYTRAARDLGLDLSRSVLIGDRWRDIAAAVEFRARGILVPSAATPEIDAEQARRAALVAPTLAAAVHVILEG